MHYGAMPADLQERIVLEAVIILVITAGFLAVAAEASGRRVPVVPAWIFRTAFDAMRPIRRWLVIAACLAAAVVLQASIVGTLADPPAALRFPGRAALVIELVLVVAWLVFLLTLRRRPRGENLD